MKHNMITYLLLALFCAAVPLYAAPADAKAKAAAAAKAKAEAAAKKKADAEARKKAQAEAKARMTEYRTFVNDMYKKKVHYDKQIENVLKLLEDRPDLKADKAVRLAAYRDALRFTENPTWTRIAYYSYDTIHKVMPVVSKLVLEDKEFSNGEKFHTAIVRLVQYYCDEQKWDEAEKWARKGFEMEGLNDQDKASACILRAKIARYQFRYDDAMKAAREAAKYNKRAAAVYAANLAIEFEKPGDAAPFWKDFGNEQEELLFYADKNRDAYVARALAFIKNEQNSKGGRFNVLNQYFLSDMSPESREARKIGANFAADLNVRAQWTLNKLFCRPFQLGDYQLTADVCKYLGSAPRVSSDHNFRCIYVISLGAIGKKAEAAKLAAEYAKTGTITPEQKTLLLAYEAILTGKDPESVIKAAKLPRREESNIYRSLARQCLGAWNMTSAAEKYTAKYETYFAKPVERRIEVKYFDTPVKDISTWRKVYPQLEKQYCDIPYKGSMDFLETDVATGDRGVVKADEGAVLEDMMELTTLCDRYGLHIFLRTSDSNALAIEQGFARGIGTEMYFAPGVNQPYVCMGSSPDKGVTFMFQTTYNNKHAKRPDLRENPVSGFRSAVEFTDKDYVLHMFFAWDLYYNKLPGPGTDWRFDCLAWSKAGGFSWGGSQGIHSASAWGNLRFNLTEKQLNEIRKGIILRSYRSFKTVRKAPGVNENLFRMWEDSIIGDPAFYNKMLAPLEAELDRCVKMVKQDMTDAEVEEVYEKGVMRWKGLTHEVDELRRRYLSGRITTLGK